MPGRGVLFALEPADERQLLAIPEPRLRAAFVANTIEERWDATWLLDIEQRWFPVHYCLFGSDGYPPSGAPPEAKAVFGGAALGVSGVYSIDYKDADLVGRIGSALSKMRDDAVWARAGLVERTGYTGPRGNNLQLAVVEDVQALAEFYRRAARAERAVIFTVDM